LEDLQVFEGSAVGAGECAFVADQQAEALAVGEVLEDVGDAIDRVGHEFELGELVVNTLGLEFDFVAEHGGFDFGDAAQAPAGGDHGFDQLDFDGAGGGELIELGLEEALEVGAGFVGEDDGCGREGGGAGG
jgi:hypothetical protein